MKPDVIILRLKCTKFDFGWGLRPRSHWRSSQRSPRPSLTGFKEVLLLGEGKGREGEGEEKERGEGGRRRRRKGGERLRHGFWEDGQPC